MRGQYVHQAMVAILLVCTVSICFSKEASDPADPNRYLNAVRTFADNVLKYGRDTYGPKHTPLFVDGLNTETLKPVVWRCGGEEWILSNFANHQSLLRLLDGLTALTGEPKYRQAALDASAYALEHLRTPNGLLYWGGHLAWDLQKDKGVSAQYDEVHELKEQSPYYELMWEANPSETKRLMETIWGAHVWDWSKLDFNRHSSSTTEPRPPQWTHEFDENLSCPFPSVGNNWSMANIAGSLLHTSVSLAKLGEHGEALLWTKRLAQRWRSAHHPLTGLCGGLLSVPQEKRAYKFLGHKHPNISDATMIAGWLMDERYRFLTICQMQVGEELVNDGFDLIHWASDDLKAFVRYAYDEKSLSFRPLLTDGTELNWREFQPGYYSPEGLAPLKASSGMLWTYATAYRLARDPAHWKFLRSVWRGFDLGDLGTETGDGRHLNLELKATSYLFLYACPDLHIATEDRAFLMLAKRVADNILAARTQDMSLPKDYFYVRTGDEYMLAVLHLVAALQGKSQRIPKPKVDRQYFHCAFSGAVGSGRTETDARVWDQPLIYSKRKGYGILLPASNEPAISLYEAITLGNGEIVSSLVAQRDDINDWYSLLSLAIQSGHKEIIEFLLEKGADVNVKGGWQEETPLHHAAVLKTRRDVAELFVTKGADLNARNWKGDTPFQYAAYSDNKEIIELLLQKGATIANLHIASYIGDLEKAEAFIKNGVNINATDGHGYSPLHYAVQNKQKEIIELLTAKGADVNVKNWSGQTPFVIAVIRGHKDIAELLINKGASISIHVAASTGDIDKVKASLEKGIDVNTQDESGQTPLHHAAAGNHKDIAALLISHGADVNAVAGTWRTPLGVAARTGSVDVAEFLIAHGANVDGREGRWTPLQEAAYYSKEMVELLLARGANINVGKWTALHSALDAERFDIVELLLAKGADVNIKDGKGRTPLHLAADYAAEKNPKIVELLLSKGADINAKDNDGKTALSLAKEKGHTEIVELLRKHGAKE